MVPSTAASEVAGATEKEPPQYAYADNSVEHAIHKLSDLSQSSKLLDFERLGCLALAMVDARVDVLEAAVLRAEAPSSDYVWTCAMGLRAAAARGQTVEEVVEAIWNRIFTAAKWNEVQQLQLCSSLAETLSPHSVPVCLAGFSDHSGALWRLCSRLPRPLAVRQLGRLLARAGVHVDGDSVGPVLAWFSQVFEDALESVDRDTVRAAAQSVFPALFGSECAQTRAWASSAVRGWAGRLMADHACRWSCQVALALLVEFARDALRDVGEEGKAPFVEAVRAFLVDEDRLVRKRALHVLDELAPGTSGMSCKAWERYRQLLDVVDEYSLHLFEDNWSPALDELHGPEDGPTPGAAVSFTWMAVVWSRGLTHPNQSAAKHVVLSFFSRSWPVDLLRDVPADWVATVLVPALGAPCMARGLHAAEIAAGRGAWARAWARAHAGDDGETDAVEELALLVLQRLADTDIPRSAIAAAMDVAAAAVAGAAPRAAGELGRDAAYGTELVSTCARATRRLKGQGTSGFAIDTLLQMFTCTTALSNLGRGVDGRLVHALVDWLGVVPMMLFVPGEPLSVPCGAWVRPAATSAEFIGALTDALRCWLDDVSRATQGDAGIEAQNSAAETRSIRGDTSIANGFAVISFLLPDPAPVIGLLVEQLGYGRTGGKGVVSGASARGWLLASALFQILELENGTGSAPPSSLRALLTRDLPVPAMADMAFKAISSASAHYIKGRDAGDDEFDVACRAGGTSALLTSLTIAAGLPASSPLSGTCSTAADERPGMPFNSPSSTIAVTEALLALLFKTAALDARDPRQRERRMQVFSLASVFAKRLPATPDLLRLLERTVQPVAVGREKKAETGNGDVSRVAPAMASGTPSAQPLASATGGAPQSTGPTKGMGWKARAAPLDIEQRVVLSAWRILDAVLSREAEALNVQQALSVFSSVTSTLPAAPDPLLVPLLRCARSVLPHVARAAAAPSSDPSDATNSIPAAHLEAALSAFVKSVWQALKRPSRRKAGVTAAMISTCLHPCLFNPRTFARCPSLYCQIHASTKTADSPSGTGPVFWIVDTLLQSGRRSCRLATLCAVQLTGCLARFPNAGVWYINVLETLCLYGFVDDATALNGMDEVVADPETRSDLGALLRPLDTELHAAWAASDVAPRVAALCLLHSWVRRGAEEGSCAAAASALWRRLLQLAVSDPDLTSSKYQFKGATHRKKVRLWQALAVLSSCGVVSQTAMHRDSHSTPDQDSLPMVMRVLSSNNASTVKQYQEVVAVVLLRAQPDPSEAVRRHVLASLCDLTSSKRDDLPSLILIASQCLLLGRASAEREEVAALARDTVLAIVPWALSHVHPVRTFAQLALWRLLDVFEDLATTDAALATMLAFFSVNADVRRLKVALGLGKDLQAFDPSVATSPAGVLYKGVALAGRSDELSTFEGAKQPLVDAISGFLVAEREKLRRDLKSRLESSVHEEYSRTTKKQAIVSAGVGGGASAKPMATGTGSAEAATGPMQQKIVPAGQSSLIQDPWTAILGTEALRDGAVDSFEAGTLEPALRDAGRAVGLPRQQLIVVASLVDKLPNLAGLARTCEVFHLHSLVVADASIVSEAQFQSISVSANLWMPIQQVTELELAPWLSQKAAQGWSLVGLEQTPESIQAPNYRWPHKTVLLLGREKEGIPAPLLALLHATVEIPQLGLIRSLNVHVSGAIAAYEFTRQGLGQHGTVPSPSPAPPI